MIGRRPVRRAWSTRQTARHAGSAASANATFARMDAEALALPTASFDVALCALGLMYMPHPEQALREMRRVLRPGGRMVSAVWGERSRCGWSAVFPHRRGGSHERRVSAVLPPRPARRAGARVRRRGLRDRRGAAHRGDARLRACRAGGLRRRLRRRTGGLAWSRFDDATRARAHARYVEAIGAWQHATGFRLPGEFVVVSATAPAARR